MSGDYVELFGFCFIAFAVGYVSSHQLLIFKKGIEVSAL